MEKQRHHATEWLWRECQSIKSQFCEAVVRAGYLTWEQMVSAACRYRLGAHPTWVSALLRQRDPFPNSPHETSHCFFGTHLLTENCFKGHTEITEITERPKGQIEITERFPTSYAQPVPEALSVISVISVCPKKSVCVVEAEKTAVIMSELYPEYVWLAAGGLGEVQVEKFRPLRGHKVVLFPDTDSDGIAFRRWSEAATLVMNQVFWEDSPPIRVSPLLETHATPEQKQAKIDLIDFLF